MESPAPVQCSGDQDVVARWMLDTMPVRVQLTSEGVRSIDIDGERAVGQSLLWDDLEAPLPELDLVVPYGRRLACEMRAALAGRPIDPEVSWSPLRPPWHVELFQHVRQLHPGRTAELDRDLRLEGAHRSVRAVAAALRRCPLLPLVPIHRVHGVMDERVRFPWGERWRERLLRAERLATENRE